jgi:hypothetical protein
MLHAQKWLTLRSDLDAWKEITKLDRSEALVRLYLTKLAEKKEVVWVRAVSLSSGLTVQRQDGFIKAEHTTRKTPPIYYLPSSSLLGRYSPTPEEANSIRWAKAQVARIEYALSDGEGQSKVQSTNIPLDMKRRAFILGEVAYLYKAINGNLNLQLRDYHVAVGEALRELPGNNLPSGKSLHSFRQRCVVLIRQRFNQVAEETFRRASFK